ncbi:hypothetical protein H9Q74_007491 [Fusarium xylarioides]|nr:hypothetical protein H9Q71_007706 [Fusarium xylarioides]KAG5822421.1 hypothetical protein H9Q74_007491 [Fusarium xylarioides]
MTPSSSKGKAPKATSQVDGYNMSQHPWYRKFREALMKGDFEPGYLLGIIKMYKGEANIPNALKTMINEWTRAGLTDPDLKRRHKDAKTKGDAEALKEVNNEIQECQEKNLLRVNELNTVRKIAATLGFSSTENDALDEKSIIMRLEFIARDKKTGHAPGNRKGGSYAKSQASKKREYTEEEAEAAQKKARVHHLQLGSSSKTAKESGADDLVASNDESAVVSDTNGMGKDDAGAGASDNNAGIESGELNANTSANGASEESGNQDDSLHGSIDSPEEASGTVPEDETQGGSAESVI